MRGWEVEAWMGACMWKDGLSRWVGVEEVVLGAGREERGEVSGFGWVEAVLSLLDGEGEPLQGGFFHVQLPDDGAQECQ